MRTSSVFAAALCGAGIASTMPAAADGHGPRHEVNFSGVSTDNNSRTGYLSYRGALNGTLNDGLYVRADVLRSNFTYPLGSGDRTAGRLALMWAIPIASGQIDIGAGLSYGREANTPVAPGDFSSLGAFAAVIGEFQPMPGHVFNGLAEYDSPDDQLFLRAFYEVELGGLAVGPVAHWVNNSTYTRLQYGLRASYNVSATTELALTVTTGNESAGGAPSASLSMIEFGLRARF